MDGNSTVKGKVRLQRYRCEDLLSLTDNFEDE